MNHSVSKQVLKKLMVLYVSEMERERVCEWDKKNIIFYLLVGPTLIERKGSKHG